VPLTHTNAPNLLSAKEFELKIILAYLSDSNDTREFSTGILPAGIFHIGAALEKKGHAILIANYSHIGYAKAIKRIEKFNPDVIAFSLLTHNRSDTMRLARAVKKSLPRTVTVAGGPHADALAPLIAERHPEMDHIIRGDGISGMTTLLSRRSAGKKTPRIITNDISLSLEDIPRYRYHGETFGVNMHEQFKYITPCSGMTMGSILTRAAVPDTGYRVPDANIIADEVEYFYRLHGIVYFSFRDEYFMSQTALLREFCREIIRRNIGIMWNCQAYPVNLDQETLSLMKSAGCERVILMAESGSDKIHSFLETGFKVSDIVSTAAAIRKTGLYLTLFLRIGVTDEKKADIGRTASLIRKVLPSDGIISPAVYYPGTAAWERALSNQLIDNDEVFESRGRSLYLRKDPEIREWHSAIRTAFALTKKKAWYRKRDFTAQRKYSGDTWVCDILEGDYLLDEENYKSAEKLYTQVISARPESIWGYIRLGKLSFRLGRFDSAEQYYRTVTELHPQYYGGWLKLAESCIAQGKKREGKEIAAKVFSMNPWDPRVQNLQNVF